MRFSIAATVGCTGGGSRAASWLCSQLRAPITVPVEISTAIMRNPRRRINMATAPVSGGHALQQDVESTRRNGDGVGYRLAQPGFVRKVDRRGRQASTQRRQHGHRENGAGERGNERER